MRDADLHAGRGQHPGGVRLEADGFRILGASLNGYTCSEDGSGTASPAVGTDGSTVNLNAVFDGWGYIHLFDAATMEDLDQFAIPEGHDPAHAENSGDLSVHEVATDPEEDLVYVSYYSGGFRVLSHADRDLQEVGTFIAGPGMTTTAGKPVTEHGNNFWGVEVHKHPNGQNTCWLPTVTRGSGSSSTGRRGRKASPPRHGTQRRRQGSPEGLSST